MLTTLLPPTARHRPRRRLRRASARGRRCGASIGAALQEAALDPLLTGREHLRLQTALHGLPRAERQARSDELLDRVGLTEAADRKVRDVLGRDEAAPRPRARARPPAADPLPRRADHRARPAEPHARSGRRSRRLARDEGVTVFLTTQYLEEADVLADRVGIIDHGTIVAEGTPAELKAEIGRPSVEAVPARPRRRATRLRAILRRFGEPIAGGAAASPCASTTATAAGRGRPRARRRRARGRGPAAARADARRRVPRQDRPLARGRGERRRIDEMPAHLVSERRRQSDREPRRRRSVVRTAPPARARDPAAALPDGAARGQLGRAAAATEAARLPDATRSSRSRSRCRSSRARSSRR